MADEELFELAGAEDFFPGIEAVDGALGEVPGVEDDAKLAAHVAEELFHVGSEVGEPLEDPCVGGLTRLAPFPAAGVPVGDGGAEFGQDEVGEDVGVDERWEDGGPDVEEGEEGGGLMHIPVVVNCGADLGEPQGEEHRFVVSCVFGFDDEAVSSEFGLGVLLCADVQDGAEAAEMLEEEEGVRERGPGGEFLSELGGVS